MLEIRENKVAGHFAKAVEKWLDIWHLAYFEAKKMSDKGIQLARHVLCQTLYSIHFFISN